MTALLLSAITLLSLIGLSAPPSRAMVDNKTHYESVWAQKSFFYPIQLPDASNSLGPWSGDNSADSLVSEGNPWENKMTEPWLVNNVYEVYSADQLRYAMIHFEDGQSIKIMRDLDFGGKESWKPIEIGEDISPDPKYPHMVVGKSLNLDGNHKTLYNLYSCPSVEEKTTTRYADAGFVTELTAYNSDTKVWYYHTIKNLTFKNIKCDSAVPALESGAACPFIAFERGEIQNVGVEDGIFHTTDRWAYGFAFLQRSMVNSDDPSGPVTIENCYTKNVVTMAQGERTEKKDEYACSCSFVGGGVNKTEVRDHKGNVKKGAVIKNCYAIGNTAISLKGHSGGFSTCTYGLMKIENCFSDVTVLGGDLSGAFQGPLHDGDFTFTDCYSLGSVDGDNVVGGFAAGFELIHDDNWRLQNKEKENAQSASFTRCYSAAIVGMQENGAGIGSFIGAPLFVIQKSYRHGTLDGIYFKDCYAVGETGGIASITKQGNASSSVGGFMGYDKYLEWDSYFPTSNNDMSFSGCYYDKQTTAARTWATGTMQEHSTDGDSDIKGVLTTTTQKSGLGLAEGPPPNSGPGSNWSTPGFTGFSDNQKWVYKKGYYPQLAVFANADPGVWGRHSELVKAYSEASASTVFLRTWDDIADVETYDTVRDLTLHFPLTSDTNTHWDLIDDPYGYGDKTAIELQYSKNKWFGVNLKPGITWVEVTATRNPGLPSEVKGKRRLRLIPIASLEAGEDKTWKVGDKHAHYENVMLRYSTPEELVEGNVTEHGYPLTEDDDRHYFTDADATRTTREYSKISVTGTPINTTTVDPNTFQVNVNLANLPFNDRANEPDPDGWRDAFSGAAALQNKHGGIFLLDYKWTLNDGRYLQDYKQVTIIKRAKAILEVRDQDNPDIVIPDAMYLNLVRKSLGAFAFDDTGGLAGHLDDFPVPAGTAMIFAWKPGSESVVAQSVSVTVASQNTVLTNPKAGDTFVQNVTGYKDLRLVDDKYFYMTVVKGSITRAIKEKDGAMIISMVGTESYDGVAFPDFEDDVEVIVYVKADSFVTLNIRQQVLGTLPPKLNPPGAGIYRLHNIKPDQPDVYDARMALPIASGSSVATDPLVKKAFTAYKLLLPSDRKAYRVEPILPQYYQYAGFMMTKEYCDHLTDTYNTSPDILAKYAEMETDKLWVTVYLRAKPGTPADHTTELQPNEFKVVPAP